MWHEVDRLVEFLIARYGLPRVLLAPCSLAFSLAGVGFLKDGAAAVVLGIGGLLFTSAVLIISLTHRLAALRLTNAELTKANGNYLDIVLEVQAGEFQWELWEEYVAVGRRGDTVIEQYLTLRVTDGRSLHVAWVAMYQSAGVPLSIAQQRRVTFVASRFTPDSGHGRRIGPRYMSTRRWEGGNRLRAVFHFDRPLRLEETAYIHVRWEWPGFYHELVAGGRDVVEWVNTRARIMNLLASVTFKEECRLGRGLDIVPHPNVPAPRYHVTREGTIQIDLEYRMIPSGERLIGLTLDASRNRAL